MEIAYYLDQTIVIPDSNTDLAYLAGIIDGEGCISRFKDGRWQFSIFSTDSSLMDWLERMGGVRTPEKVSKLGKKQGWRWYVSSHKNIIALLEAVEPYLIIKRDKALLALSELRSKVKNLELCRNGLHDLSVTGVRYTNGTRRCRACQNATSRRRRERLRKENLNV